MSSFKGDFMRKKSLPALGFKPTTFQLSPQTWRLLDFGLRRSTKLVATPLGALTVAIMQLGIPKTYPEHNTLQVFFVDLA